MDTRYDIIWFCNDDIEANFVCSTFPETMSILVIISHRYLVSTSRKPDFSSTFRSNWHALICCRCRNGIKSSLLYTPHLSIALSSKSGFEYIVLFFLRNFPLSLWCRCYWCLSAEKEGPLIEMQIVGKPASLEVWVGGFQGQGQGPKNVQRFLERQDIFIVSWYYGQWCDNEDDGSKQRSVQMQR